jgi:chromosomal replication initiator protein
MTPEIQEQTKLRMKLLQEAARIQFGRPTPKRKMASIAVEIASEHLLDVSAIRERGRAQRLYRPRAKAMLAMYREGYSYPQIGRYFNRDHTTVIHACNRALLWERSGV